MILKIWKKIVDISPRRGTREDGGRYRKSSLGSVSRKLDGR